MVSIKDISSGTGIHKSDVAKILINLEKKKYVIFDKIGNTNYWGFNSMKMGIKLYKIHNPKARITQKVKRDLKTGYDLLDKKLNVEFC